MTQAHQRVTREPCTGLYGLRAAIVHVSGTSLRLDGSRLWLEEAPGPGPKARALLLLLDHLAHHVPVVGGAAVAAGLGRGRGGLELTGLSRLCSRLVEQYAASVLCWLEGGFVPSRRLGAGQRADQSEVHGAGGLGGHLDDGVEGAVAQLDGAVRSLYGVVSELGEALGEVALADAGQGAAADCGLFK